MIFVGHDSREQEAFDVCKFSVESRSNLKVYKLSSADIPEYSRNFGEPQSTDFTFTRFWVPYLSGYKGFSIFCDCDFLFLEDPTELIKIAKMDPTKAVWVAQHPTYIPKSALKMDNISQNSYEMKNWSSLMVFNNEHYDCSKLTPEWLNNHPRGIDFHKFNWTDANNIGSIPLDWNCLDGYYHLENPKAIHYTDGGPWFEDYRETFYSDLWYKERKKSLTLEKK